jgi:hypothetical protein
MVSEATFVGPAMLNKTPIPDFTYLWFSAQVIFIWRRHYRGGKTLNKKNPNELKIILRREYFFNLLGLIRSFGFRRRK